MLNINDLSVAIEGRKILSQLTLEVFPGDFISILGPNGAGKSTLLKAVLGLITPQNGNVSWQNHNIQTMTRKDIAKAMTLVPQETYFQFDYTVAEVVLMGRFPWVDYWGNYSIEDYQIVEEVLVKLSIEFLKDRLFNTLSGGEKQKVLVARAMAQKSGLIMLDETLSFLDLNHQIEIMDILKKINRDEGKTILIISHNINLSSAYSNRVVILKDGSLIADGKPEDLISKLMIKKVFGVETELMINPDTGKPVIYYSKHEEI